MRVGTSSNSLMWILRASWVALLLASPWHVAAHHSTPVNVVLIIGGWAMGASGLLSSIALTPIGLTVVRLVTVPMVALVASQASYGITENNATVAMTLALVAIACAAALACTTRVSTAMVQAGAYGDETRYPLRTPFPYVLPAALVQLGYTAAIISGPLLLAARSYAAGVAVTLIAVAASFKVPRRLHQLSRRWLVVVPAGLVVHDHLVLAETFMVRHANLADVRTADGPGEEADLTGGVFGRRLVVSLTAADKVVLAPITRQVLGTTDALHVSSFSIAPRQLDAAMARLKK